MLCTGKTLWGRKPVGLGLSVVVCRYHVYVSHVSLNILVLCYFLFRTFAKQFYISARIQTNLRDNFIKFSAL